MKMSSITVIGLMGAMVAGAAKADDSARDSMAGHDMAMMHSQTNQWMFEYRWMRMSMEGLLDGSNKVSARDISGSDMNMMGPPAPAAGKDYLMAPVKMTMDMHMLMAMRGISERLSIMGTLNYLRNDGQMVMYEGMDSMVDRMKTSGLGDSMLEAAYSLNPAVKLSMGLSIPTGSIDQKGTMMNIKTRFPYTAQLGSGTYDMVPGIIYLSTSGVWEWGAEGSFTYRMGKNNNDYALGNRLDVSARTVYSINDQVQILGRLAAAKWGKIKGQDPAIDPMMSPDGDPKAQGGKRVDALVGIDIKPVNNHLVKFEVGAPVYQNLNGPQLKTQWLFSLGYQYMM